MNTLITQLQILKMSDTKPNFSELARMYNLDRRTVKKYYEGYTGKPAHRDKSSILDQYQDIIKTKLAIKGINMMSVYQFLITKIGPDDIGSYSNFRKYVVSKGLKPPKTQKGHPRYETAPGIQAQVDWKENVTLTNRYGENFTFQVFDYKLGYSRYPVFIYKLTKTRQDVFNCLIECFKTTGGVPRKILFDNMSSVVDRDGNKINISNAMKAFAKDFGFEIDLCKPRHPFTKGKVEAANKFHTWLLAYDHEFDDENDIIEILAHITKTVREKVCQETGIPPILLFQKEKEYLQPLPDTSIIESYLSFDRQTIVRNDSMVCYNNSRYSVPPAYIGKPVKLHIENDKLLIYYSTDLIATHTLSDKRLNYNASHYKELLSKYVKNSDAIDDMALNNLKQMDNFL